ncbi:MAG: hypothetical protein MI757_21025 [Pirellulales bacterium]|nr:hypothetical protein [Pirellulales bacterium]
MFRIVSPLFVILAFLATKGASCDEPSDEQIHAWIEQLGDESFRVREQAEGRLRKTGIPALPALAKEAYRDRPEIRSRSREILIDLATHSDGRTEKHAAFALRAFMPTKEINELRENYQKEWRRSKGVDLIKTSGTGTVTSMFVRSDTFDDADAERLVRYMERHRSVSALDFRGAKLTDKGLAELANIASLRTFKFRRAEITDEGLKGLWKRPRTTWVSLYGIEITDKGLANLAELPRLRHIDIDPGRVTEAGVAALKKKLPHCEVNFHGR